MGSHGREAACGYHRHRRRYPNRERRRGTLGRCALREVGQLPAVQEGIRKLGLEPEFQEDFGAALAAQRLEWAAIAKETRITLE